MFALREGNLVEAGNIFTEVTLNFQKDQNPGGVAFTLEGIASLHVTLGNANLAARLIGWADATREKIHETRPLLEQADVDRDIAAIIAKTGNTAFEEAYKAGRIMPLEEAVDYALEEL